MKARVRSDNNTQDIKFIPINENLNNDVIPIKMEMGNDIKVPFLKSSPYVDNKDNDLYIPSSSKSSDSKKSRTLSQGQEKKSRSFLKKEDSNNHSLKENGDSLNNSPNLKKTLAMIKRLQSDLTPQAILPASRGKRIHTSLGNDTFSPAKRIKLSQKSESFGRNSPDVSLLKQEPFSPNGECNTQANNSTFSSSNASQPIGSCVRKLHWKSVKFKNESSSNFKRPNDHTLGQIVTEDSTTTCISSTIVSHSSTTTKARGGRTREIDQLYNNLREINWARDKEFTSLLYAKDSVRHSDRNSNIKAAITDRSKKLAKLVKMPKSSSKYSTKLKPQPKLTKIIKPALAVKSRAKLTVPIQKKKNVLSHQILKCKRPEISKNVKSRSISQQLKLKFQQKKVPLSKNQDLSRKVKSKAVSHQLKMNQKIISIAKQNEMSKNVTSKVASQEVKIPQKNSVVLKPNGSVKKDEKEIKVVYQKLKPSSTMKKKIPIQSVKPIVDYEKKCSLVNGVKSTNSKLTTPSVAPNWKNIACDMTSMANFLPDNRNPHVLSALHNNPELRVTVTPLETTHPWSSDFNFQNKLQREFDAHNRRLLQEKMHKVYASMDHSHVSSVLQEVHDSIGIFPATAKLPEEKTKKSVRSSVRQSECAFRYKEIVVKKHDNYLQVVLVPNIQKQNSLTIDAIKELREAFVSAKKDTNCNAVLLSSSGSFFCSGIDLGQLYGTNKKHIAEEMASALKDLILTLALFPKPVVAAVNGSAVGLGVSLLMYCDIILASDKATFCIPAAKMGYVPEGGVALTLPQVVGSSCAIEMLLHGRRLTAQQALKFGMVSEVLWPTQLMEEVIPRVRSLAEQPLQVMEITKTMVRCHLWEKLPAQLEHEWRLLPAQWLSSECQQNIKKLLQTGWLFEY